MDNIQRRLELNRGGKATQTIQKEVLVRLDEMIKEKENQQKQQSSGQPNGGNCPGGGSPSSGPASGNTPSSPASETALPSGESKGIADAKAKVKQMAEVWGNLPAKERAAAMLELTRTLDPKYKDAVELYLKELQRRSGAGD